MAQSPRFKVYTPEGDYVAACKLPGDAAALASLHGEGAAVRAGHQKRHTVWTEGVDGWAGESYDQAAETIRENLATL